MICPQCGAEYREGFTRCWDCEVDLVDALPEPEEAPQDEPASGATSSALPARTPRDDPPERFDLVAVLTTTDPGLIGIAESLLRSADIPYVCQGNNVVDLFGIGRLSGVNPITGAPRLLVAAQDADDAREILADLESSRWTRPDDQGPELKWRQWDDA